MSEHIIGQRRKLISTTENGTVLILQVNTDGGGLFFFLNKCKRSPKMTLGSDIILKGVSFTKKHLNSSFESISGC